MPETPQLRTNAGPHPVDGLPCGAASSASVLFWSPRSITPSSSSWAVRAVQFPRHVSKLRDVGLEMTIRPLGGGWQPAVLFELIHIPKRAPELDIGPSGGPSYERRGSTTRSEEDQFNLKEDVSQPMREGRRREGRQAGGRQAGRKAGKASVIPFSRLLLPYMDLQSDNGARRFRPK